MTATAAPLPAALKTANTQNLRAGIPLHRIHDQRFPGQSFNPCLGGRMRFSPVHIGGTCIPTLYAGETLNCAIYESIFHDVTVTTNPQNIAKSKLDDRAYTIIAAKRELVLLNLFAMDLQKLGKTRPDVIETTSKDYRITATWAAAVYENRPDVDGLIWTSRRGDPDFAVVLFEPRCGSEIYPIAEQIKVTDDPDLMNDVVQAGIRANISLVI